MPYKDAERQKQAQQEWYQRKRAIVLQRSREQKARYRAWLAELKDRPCVDCGLEWPSCVMEFHHRDSGNKLGSIGKMLGNVGRERILAEINKCDLLCANCHRIRTHCS